MIETEAVCFASVHVSAQSIIRLLFDIVPISHQVRRYFEEIDITPKPGMIYCTSHSLKMFMSYINRRHDGSKRKATLLM